MKKQAFTLVEIMVVLVILGVLSSIAFPKYLKAMEIRKADIAIQQMKLIKTNIVYLLGSRVNLFGTAPAGLCISACDTTDSINTVLEMDIHNSHFTFSTTSLVVTANRTNNTIPYTLTLAIPGNVEDIECTGSGCSMIKM